MVWWKQYPKTESRKCRQPPPGGAPQSLLAVGTLVRLRGKPERARRIVSCEWHWYRYEYVYVVETASGFAAYWFAPQLLLVEPEAAP
jgi:hypothetical protein